MANKLEFDPRLRQVALQIPVVPNGKDNGDPQVPSSDRRLSVEAWRSAEAKTRAYSGGDYQDKNHVLHKYRSGARLSVNGFEVMDTCEKPWCYATVDLAFQEIWRQKQGQFKVLERGYGLGITARRIKQFLDIFGGQYDCIELNHKIAEQAKSWAEKEEKTWRERNRDTRLAEPKTRIKVYEGDAMAATRKRAQKIAEGRENKADIIISDTYPLTSEEQGMNDLVDLETLKRCLAENGVFTFFSFFPGSKGGIVKAQRDMVLQHFKEYRLLEIPVEPPPHYRYLQTEDGPVEALPVIICKNPKL